MTLKTITEEQYNRLVQIQKEYPLLTFQNEGYQYVNKDNFTENDKKAFKEVSSILSKSILGFTEFNNFKIIKEVNNFVLRFQYNYGTDNDNGYYFIGVGYIGLNELLNGFEKD